MYSDCTPDYLKMTALNIPAALVVCCLPSIRMPLEPQTYTAMRAPTKSCCPPSTAVYIGTCTMSPLRDVCNIVCACIASAGHSRCSLCFRTGPDGPQAVYTWFYRKGLHFCIATSGNQEAASQARSAVLPCSLCVQLVLVVHIVCRPYWHCSG